MSPTAGSPTDRRTGVLVFAAAAAVALGLSLVGWHHNVLEAHEFRQAQTALTIRWLARDGWSLAYPLPLFGPPWSAPMEFPWYQGMVAAVRTLLHSPLEPTARAVSLLLWALTLPGIHRAAGFLGIESRRRWYLLAAVVLSPVYLYYSRAVMIESTALCAAVWFLCSFERALTSGRIRWVAVAATVGAIAALAKITTFAVFLVPAGWLAASRVLAARASGEPGHRRTFRTLLLAAVPIACSIGAGLAWSEYGDAVKSANPLAASLAAPGLSGWVFGSLSQRIDPGAWRMIGTVVHGNIVNGWVLGGALIAALGLGGASRIRALGLAGCYLAGPLLFTNVYVVHDYYHYAAGLFLLAATLLGWFAACDRLKLRGAAEIAGVIALLVTEGVTFSHSYFRLQQRPDLPPPELARLIGAATTPEDVVLMYGYEWNPVIPYFADRRAVMVRREHLGDLAAQGRVLGPIRDHVAAIVFHGDAMNHDPLVRWTYEAIDVDQRPVLVRGDTRVFFARRSFAEAIARLRITPREEFTLLAPPEREVDGLKYYRHLRTEALAVGAAEVFSPVPDEILTPWGLAGTTIGGRPAFNAHAPTDIVCTLPAGAAAIEVEYGIAPEAYADPAKATDGVEFRIEWLPPGRPAVTLFRRSLTPAGTAADRGPQTASIAVPPSAAGSVVFRTLPGPANNLSFDWGYWRRARVRPAVPEPRR